MQLDQTHVVIRTRSIAEIGDLALMLLRQYPAPLLRMFFLFALPWIVFNTLLLAAPLIAMDESSNYGDETDGRHAKYVIWMLTLVILQTPAAGVAATFFLGQAVFEERPTAESVRRQVRKTFWRWFYLLAGLRLPIVAMLWLAIRMGQPFDPFDVLMPIALLSIASLLRANRPFLPEILLLEQCPLRGGRGKAITASQRSSHLHRPYAGDLFGRFCIVSLGMAGIAAGLFSVASSAQTLVFGGGEILAALEFYVWFPLSLWLAAATSVVVRLLNYLDCRIRLEGWDVELAVRAEAIRQFGSHEREVATA